MKLAHSEVVALSSVNLSEFRIELVYVADIWLESTTEFVVPIKFWSRRSDAVHNLYEAYRKEKKIAKNMFTGSCYKTLTLLRSKTFDKLSIRSLLSLL